MGAQNSSEREEVRTTWVLNNRKNNLKIFYFTLSLFFVWIGHVAYTALMFNWNGKWYSIKQITLSSRDVFPEQKNLANIPPEQLISLLSQPFYYLNHGSQCYAFESADELYVIKFVKANKIKSLNLFLIPSSVCKKIDAQYMYTTRRANKIMTSFALAMQYLSEESGLLYAHFNQEEPPVDHVSLFDVYGLPHKIPLKNTIFLVQKKGLTTHDFFSCEPSEEEVIDYLEQIKNLYLTRSQMGIYDQDSKTACNLGYFSSEKRACFMDVGKLCMDVHIKEKKNQTYELETRLDNLRGWIKNHFPKYENLANK